MKARTILTLWLLLCHLLVMGQNEGEPWADYLEQTGELEDVEAAEWAGTHELLNELAEHPLNLNTASRDDLRQLPFLTDTEIEAIQEYVYRYGPMRSIGELAMIRVLDYNKRQLLQHFVYIGSEEEPQTHRFPKWKNILKYGKHNVLATAKIPCYERKGDQNGYLGYPYKHNIRYTFNYGQAFKAGIVGAQDAGEPFLANRNKAGYDFYSFYVVMRGMGRLKTLALGRYRVGFGNGLVINNNFTLGKLGMLSNLGRSQDNIRSHSSTLQASYLQGAAATVDMGRNLSLSAFASWRYLDATLTDSGDIQTIRTDGYHRTVAEMDKKDNASQTAAGGHLNWSGHGFHLGMTATYSHLSRDLQPGDALYRRYHPRGNDFWNASVDYGYNGARLTLNGETATGKGGALGTLNMVSWKVTDDLLLTGVQRFYSKRYHSLFSQGFSAGGRVQNESGLLVGLRWQPLRKVLLTAYTDYAYFPWPRHQAGQASHLWDHLLQLTLQPNASWTVNMRYRLKRQEQDLKERQALDWKQEHRGRLFANYQHRAWSCRTQGDVAYTTFEGKKSLGWMISEQLLIKGQGRHLGSSPMGTGASGKWQVSAGIGYFHTDDFDSRVYAYERGMRYNFNFPVFYGKGIRYWLMANVTFSEHLQVAAKAGTTNYFDRSSIGSDYQEINHSAMTDVEVQFRWNL